MRKLLRADFARLRVNKTFWVVMLGMVGVCLFLMFDLWQWRTRYPDVEAHFENYLFNYAPFMGFCLAMIVGMLTGADYSDGTMRNKLIVGRERWEIYLSHLIVSSAIGALLVLGCVVPMLLIGLPMSSGFGIPSDRAALMILFSIPATVAFAAICTAITMGIQNRTAAVIVCFVVMMVLFCGNLILNGRLGEPEMTRDYAITVNGVEASEEKPNPFYIGGTKRVVYQWIHDTLPSGQTIQMADGADPEHMERWPFTSAAVILLSSAIGYAIFKRKDIK